MTRPLVWFIPEQPGDMVTMHACWGADFMGETAVFPTQKEAVEFCWKRWRRNDPMIKGPAVIDGRPPPHPAQSATGNGAGEAIAEGTVWSTKPGERGGSPGAQFTGSDG